MKNIKRENVSLAQFMKNFNMDYELNYNAPMLNILIFITVEHICKIMFLFLRHTN